MSYRIIFLPKAEAEFTALPDKICAQVKRKIDALAENPRPLQYKKLKTPLESYRIRSGDYRIVYQIKDDVLIVLIIRVGHRREVYRNRP